jgi:hypothetical protein
MDPRELKLDGDLIGVRRPGFAISNFQRALPNAIVMAISCLQLWFIWLKEGYRPPNNHSNGCFISL